MVFPMGALVSVARTYKMSRLARRYQVPDVHGLARARRVHRLVVHHDWLYPVPGLVCSSGTYNCTRTDVCLAAFFPFPEPDAPAFAVAAAAAAEPGNGSSLGRISMRKSNWSDLLTAFAMSARDRVRRLLESAMMNARAVISAINTTDEVQYVTKPANQTGLTFTSLAEEDRC